MNIRDVLLYYKVDLNDKPKYFIVCTFYRLLMFYFSFTAPGYFWLGQLHGNHNIKEFEPDGSRFRGDQNLYLSSLFFAHYSEY